MTDTNWWPEAERPQAIREALQQIEAEIPRLRRYARHLGYAPDHADDLVQEGLVRAVAEIPTATAKIQTGPPGTSLRGWLFAILRSCHIEETRRGQHPDAPASTRAASSPTTRRNQEAGAALPTLRDAYLSLSEERREVLLLVAIEGLQHEEAAAILGAPLGAVRSRLSQGRQALRQALEASPPAALASPLLAAPHAGHQYLMAPCMAVSMPEGVPLERSASRGHWQELPHVADAD